jgi:hypothetical protein
LRADRQTEGHRKEKKEFQNTERYRIEILHIEGTHAEGK